MAKLENTIINGNLAVAGDIIINDNDSTTLKSISKISYENKFSYDGGTNYYYIPVVIWHGKIYGSTTPYVVADQSSGCSLSISFVSTGTYYIIMSGINTLSENNTEYQVLAVGLGTTNQTTTPCYVTCPDSYKNKNNFRLIISDQYIINKNGSCEITIIKFMRTGPRT